MRSKLIKAPNRTSKSQTNCYSQNFMSCLLIFSVGFIMWWRMSDLEGSLLRTDKNAMLNLRSISKSYRDEMPQINKQVIILPKKRRIAFAITITKDGNFQDGAAVLAYSLYQANMTTIYDISLVAFVHPNVTTSRPILRDLGYHVIEAQTPINVSAIQFEFLRTKINKNGCCGASELIKLNSYRLTQYEVVVHMDADTMVTRSFGELFDINKSLIYTTDPNMATFKMDYKQPAQGGFLILKPSVRDYEALINILLTTEFVIYNGWNHTEVGWFWGGMTVQGILPYYYNIVTEPNRALKVNRCVYNSMADTKECQVQTLSEIKTVHFAGICQKPWTCLKHHQVPLCKVLHDEWFRLRYETEIFYQLSAMKYPCGKNGHNYEQMDLTHAMLPKNVFIPDDSPDELLPIGNSGFLNQKEAKKVKWNR